MSHRSNHAVNRPLRGERVLSQSTMDRLFIAQILLNVIALVVIIAMVWNTNTNAVKAAAADLRRSDAVARCTTERIVHGLHDIAKEIGIRIDVPVPIIVGLDCDAVLGVPPP